MRSDFLHCQTSGNARRGNKSQSLLNEVWFPSWKSLYGGLELGESQSLLNEVWFPSSNSSVDMSFFPRVAIPSKWGLISFRTTEGAAVRAPSMSQSLLNEVWFPSVQTSLGRFNPRDVAIPSKWGLISFIPPSESWRPAGVAIPSKWGLISFAGRGSHMFWLQRRNPF